MMLIMAIAGLSCLVYGYYKGEEAGYRSGEVVCLSKLNSLEQDLTSKCMARIDELESNREKLNAEINQYVLSLSTLRHKSDDLRLRIQTLQSNRTDATPSSVEPSSSSELSSKRLESLGSLLEEATNLIRERDEIAASYNELRKKCQSN